MAEQTTTGADLHTRIREAIQERIRLAKAATPGPWRTWAGDNVIVEQAAGDHMITEMVRCEEHPDWIRADAEHIAANDPAATIRLAESRLRTLDRHAPEVITYAGGSDNVECKECQATYPCAEVRDLADGEGIELPSFDRS